MAQIPGPAVGREAADLWTTRKRAGMSLPSISGSFPHAFASSTRGFAARRAASFSSAFVCVICVICGAIIVLSLSGCRLAEVSERSGRVAEVVGVPDANLSDRCVGDYRADVDYFPQKLTIRHAKSFSVTYHGSYKVLHFRPLVGTQEQIDYVLVQCGAPVPTGYPAAQIVQVPVSRFVTQWPSYHLLFHLLNLEDRLVGVESLDSISIPSLLDRARDGRLHAVGAGTHASIELTMAVDPEVIFTFYSAFPNANVHPKLWDLGMHAVPLGDHFEGTPLGRSEWMKFLAAFFNREHDVEQLFDEVTARYEAIRLAAAGAPARPRVMLGFASDRTFWSENGRRNYMAQLIDDAGGDYVWHSDSMRTLEPIPFELVFDDNIDTDVWLGTPVGAPTVGVLVGRDARMRWFGPVRRDGVFSNDVGRLPSGATPAANESLTRPDALLADLVRVLHPERMPAHQFTYFQEITP